MHSIINKLTLPPSKFILLFILFISACNHSYKPVAHITEASMKEAATESYATLKYSIKELKGVFLPTDTEKTIAK